MAYFKSNDEYLARVFGRANLVAKQYYDQMQRISESISYFDSMSTKQLMQYQPDSFIKAMGSSALIQDKMGGNIDPLKAAAMAFQDKINAYQSTAEAVARTVGGFLKGAQALQDKLHYLTKFQDAIYELSTKYDWSELDDTPLIEILESDNKTLVVQGNVVKLVDVEDKLNELYERITNAITYDEFIDRIDTLIRNTTTKPLRIVMNYIIVIILSITANLLTPHINSLSDNNNTHLRIKVIQNIGRDVLRDTPYNSRIRFVSVDRLCVRLCATRKSKKIDILELGQVVFIKYKRKNWSYIEYIDADTSEVNGGWVFTRYLKRFKY